MLLVSLFYSLLASEDVLFTILQMTLQNCLVSPMGRLQAVASAAWPRVSYVACRAALRLEYVAYLTFEMGQQTTRGTTSIYLSGFSSRGRANEAGSKKPELPTWLVEKGS